MATVDFPAVDNEAWLKARPVDEWKTKFADDGFLVIPDLLTKDSVSQYDGVYSRMLSGEIDTSRHRHDLGIHNTAKGPGEKITQIMWPSEYVPSLLASPLYSRTRTVAQALLGDDMEFDFDHLIAKAAQTETCTPWHSDESYWPDMPDKRAVSFWVAMTDATVDNGCMWFIAGSHKEPMRKHRAVAPGVHTMMCDASDNEGNPEPLDAGGCTLHQGRTLHYTRGNTTDKDRRAFIVVYRPKPMIDWIRERGYDHGKEGVDECLDKTRQDGQNYRAV